MAVLRCVPRSSGHRLRLRVLAVFGIWLCERPSGTAWRRRARLRNVTGHWISSAPDPPLCAATWSLRRLACVVPNWMFCVRSLPQPNGPANAFGSAGERAHSPRRAWLSLQEALPASRLGSMRRPALSGRRQGKACYSVAGRLRSGAAGASPSAISLAEHRVEFGVGPDRPDLLRAAAGGGREGTSTIVSPPMACWYWPSVTAPSVATMLAGWVSSPPADTYTPALMASWTAARAALATAGMSWSGMWSIAWAPNEIRYCVIQHSVVPAACSGRVLTQRRTTRPGIHRSAKRNFSRVPAIRPREGHVTRVRGNHRRWRRLQAVQPHSSDAAIVTSVRLCHRAEPGHLLTGAVPWQTERQPRIFGDKGLGGCRHFDHVQRPRLVRGRHARPASVRTCTAPT